MNTILVIDLGKCNSVSCHYDAADKAARFHTFRTTPHEAGKLICRVAVAPVVHRGGSAGARCVGDASGGEL